MLDESGNYYPIWVKKLTLPVTDSTKSQNKVRGAALVLTGHQSSIKNMNKIQILVF